MSNFKARSIFALFFLVLLIFQQPILAQCPNLVWNDEFDGTALDESKWSYQTGDGCSEGICGWGNSELQFYKAENATVSNGILQITAKEERVRGSRYTSARIRTINKGDWVHGRFEARIKMTETQGLWPAFWMLSTDEVYGTWPQSGEIDIMENIGREPSTVHGTIHFGDPFPNNSATGGTFELNNGAFADDYYVFAVEREPNLIRWLVNDVEYLVKTPADVAPSNWPFEERFHLILNVAVGGVFPGDPDATTVLPQVLEVDYVRVYDGNKPHVTGNRDVENQESGVVYSVGNAPAGSSFSWSVPPGATIVSGQGTSSITVDWGGTGGDVTVDVSNSCENTQLAINVFVKPEYFFDFPFENFDDPANVTFSSATGVLNEIPNPTPSAVNGSAMSGEYTRNSGEQYDTLVYTTSNLPDATAYVDQLKRFYIDVYTSAPVGSVVLLQLEDSSSATASNYPTGRHSRFQGVTTVQNQWERIALDYLDQPDPTVADSAVDTVIFLYEPNTFTSDTYIFDNFDSYTSTPGGGPPAAPSNLSASTVSSSAIDLAWDDNSTDEDGFEVERSADGTNFSQIATVGSNVASYSDSGLSASTTYHYRVRAYNASGNSGYSNTASATTSGGGTPTSMSVSSIVVGTQGAGQGNKRGTATVTITDNLGNAVGSAVVNGTFSGDFNESASGVTTSGGEVLLTTNGVKKGTIVLTFCVDSVTHPTLTYDPGSNVQTCASL